MKVLYSLFLIASVLTSCESRSRHCSADPGLAAQLPVTVESLGISEIPEEKTKLQDYRVTITNKTGSPVFLAHSTQNYHSQYIKERNPKVIGYDTDGGKKSWHLHSRGVSGAGGLLSVENGSAVTFIAPIPIFPNDRQGGEFRFVICAYLDKKQREGRFLYSETVLHNERRIEQ